MLAVLPANTPKLKESANFLKKLIDSALATPLPKTVYLRAHAGHIHLQASQAVYITHRPDGY